GRRGRDPVRRAGLQRLHERREDVGHHGAGARRPRSHVHDLRAHLLCLLHYDAPPFNVYMSDVKTWGITALERAARGLTCTTCVHICYGYGIKANLDWKATLGGEWRQYEEIFPALAKSEIKQVSLECIHSRVPPRLMELLKGKDVLVGVIDVASERVETAQEVAARIKAQLQEL